MRADVAVIGAGCFGVWIAWHLHRAGRRVLLIDAYGAANSRASSGDESRIIRMGYGPREHYTKWSVESLPLWRALASRTDPSLFHDCGALWMTSGADPFALSTVAVLEQYDVSHQTLNEHELRQRFPQFAVPEGSWAILEPEAGALMARRAIQTLVREMVAEGVTYEQSAVRPGDAVDAEQIVFACGPWLPALFPELLGKRIIPTRQEVLFFGTPSGSDAFSPLRMPCWIDVSQQVYGLPDLESRGFKIANDRRGAQFNPDTGERTVSAATIEIVREYLRSRIPALAHAPLLESRVCQYENTSNGDYLLDRHPEIENVWLAGGGSGHGFKHGPAVGAYLSGLMLGSGTADERFSFSSKAEGITASSL
ncbi:MAG TPA: FAD-dependent oxidoreductase [Bryobacteraceae bacterium]|nr:FAD-dependent oxidoreductase [Bryobacteraceae bacterium]